MTKSHTPGPWTMNASFMDGVDSTHKNLFTVGLPGEIAFVRVHPRAEFEAQAPDMPLWPASCAEAEANAKLIAAAPDLLSVARKFAEGCERGEQVGEKFFSELLDEARAACAKT